MKWKKNKANKDHPSNEKSHIELEAEEIELLRNRVINEAPERGYQNKSSTNLRFENLPISSKTLQGLKDSNLIVPTDIQAAAIPHALASRDILGAAKTGSGKTLAFVIPIIERLFRENWSPEDGVGAIIITPTRELALQIFQVLRDVGKKHSFSAGLVTGGKKEFEGEQERIININILVATPGRLLQVINMYILSYFSTIFNGGTIFSFFPQSILSKRTAFMHPNYKF